MRASSRCVLQETPRGPPQPCGDWPCGSSVTSPGLDPQAKGTKPLSPSPGVGSSGCSAPLQYFCQHWLKQRYWNERSCSKYKVWLPKRSWAPFFSGSLLQIIRLLFTVSLGLFSIVLSDRPRKDPFLACNLWSLSLVLLWSALSSDQSPRAGELLLSYHLLGIHSWKIALSWEVAMSLFLGAPFKWMIKVYQPALLALCSVQNFFLSTSMDFRSIWRKEMGEKARSSAG